MTEDRKKKALVVDDSPTDQGSVCRLLQNHNYEAHKATNGKEALELMSGERFDRLDLLVVDLMMPIMDGFDFISAVKSTDEWSSIPIIVITGNSKQEHVLRLIPFKINGFIVKPVTHDKLTHQLGHIIENSKRPETTFKKGEVIFDVGEPSDRLFQVTQGYVGIYKKSVVNSIPVGIVSPYEFLGEMSLMEEAPHSSQAVALTEVKAHHYDKKEFEILLESSSMPVAALISDLIRRLQKTNNILRTASLTDPDLDKRIQDIKNRDNRH